MLTEVICDVVSGRTFVPNVGKVLLTPLKVPRVDHSSLCKHHQAVEEGDDIALRLVNGEDDRTVVLPSQGDQRFDNVVCVVRIETCSRTG